jgi:hypothetical protein
MPRQPIVARAVIHETVVAYLTSNGSATWPEIRRHVAAELHVSERYARHATGLVIHGAGFVLELQAHRGPRTVHVRLAPPRRRLTR